MSNSFSISARKKSNGKFEGRIALNGRHLASGTFDDRRELEDYLDAQWDSVLVRFRNGKKT